MKRNMFVASLSLFVAGTSQAAVLWDETLNGDLSSVASAPTTTSVTAGSNTVEGTVQYASIVGDSDRDFLHIHLAPGQSITNIYLDRFVGQDEVAFFGVVEGSSLTFNPDFANPNDMLGYVLFEPGLVNFDLLPLMAGGGGAQGFTPPLTGTDYTFWIQQMGDPTDYKFNFVVAPEPASFAPIGLGLLALVLRRRK